MHCNEQPPTENDVRKLHSAQTQKGWDDDTINRNLEVWRLPTVNIPIFSKIKLIKERIHLIRNVRELLTHVDGSSEYGCRAIPHTRHAQGILFQPNFEVSL